MKYFIYILFIISFLFSFSIIGIDMVALWISFGVNLFVFYYYLFKVISSKDFDPFLIITFIFFYLFFFIAPIFQLNNNKSFFPNGLPVNESSAIIANFLILLFYIILFRTTFYYKRKRIKINNTQIIDYSILKKYNKIVFRILAIAFIAFLIGVPSILSSLNKIATDVNSDDKFKTLIIYKFVMMIPFSCLLILMNFKELIPKQKFWLFIIILLLLTLILKNPITEKRNAVGPIYFTILYFFFENTLKNSKKFFLVVFTVFLIFFPLSSLLTHTYGSFDSRISTLSESLNFSSLVDIIQSHFIELHYDAWSMVIATVQYVQIYSATYGYALFGALFFFIPRSIWITKPEGSGQQIVEKYISNYGMEFSNVSCPFLAEAYYNFGIPGVILFAIILGYLLVLAYNQIKNKTYYKYFSLYFSFYLIFLYRGDLMNAFAYFAAFFASFVFAKKIILYKIKTKTYKY